MSHSVINPADIVVNIFQVRAKKVILDFHLADLYEVETRVLKQQVKRNMNRFPDDFMFQLTSSEWRELITNCDMLGNRKFSPVMPYAFTEQGVSMLSGVLNSQKAIEVNIAIMRAFVKLRELMIEYDELRKKIETLEAKYDKQFKIIFEVIKELIFQKKSPRKPVGYIITSTEQKDRDA